MRRPGGIKGKRISAYPSGRPEIVAVGGIYADIYFVKAVTDDHFVAVPAWTAHVELLKQFTARLNRDQFRSGAFRFRERERHFQEKKR